MDLEARYPTEADIQELLLQLSLEDRRELLIQAVDPEWAIRHSIETSVEVVAVVHRGRVACITGVREEDGLAPSASPWLLGTPVMQRYPRLVMKYSRELLARWSARFPFMRNYVDARHLRALAWLRHLGANFEYLPEYGPYRVPFYLVTFGEDPCVSLPQPE